MKKKNALIILLFIFAVALVLLARLPGEEAAPVDLDLEESPDISESAPAEEASNSEEIILEPLGEAEFDLSTVPDYSGDPYVSVNGNLPFFTEEDMTDNSYEYYSPLDDLGRCGVCSASIGQDLMPTGQREDIYMIHPSGWHSVRYDFVDGESLYNRSHLIGFLLTGESANEQNLITGTRYMNSVGMLPFEEEVAEYVEETGNHVLYRITPVFVDDELLARGVLMEAESVEDRGQEICFCVYCYNVQPGVVINYENGDSELAPSDPNAKTGDYVLNTGSKKIHLPSCDGATQMKAGNRQEYSGSYDLLIAQGYLPCSSCHPEQH